MPGKQVQSHGSQRQSSLLQFFRAANSYTASSDPLDESTLDQRSPVKARLSSSQSVQDESTLDEEPAQLLGDSGSLLNARDAETESALPLDAAVDHSGAATIEPSSPSAVGTSDSAAVTNDSMETAGAVEQSSCLEKVELTNPFDSVRPTSPSHQAKGSGADDSSVSGPDTNAIDTGDEVYTPHRKRARTVASDDDSVDTPDSFSSAAALPERLDLSRKYESSIALEDEMDDEDLPSFARVVSPRTPSVGNRSTASTPDSGGSTGSVRSLRVRRTPEEAMQRERDELLKKTAAAAALKSQTAALDKILRERTKREREREMIDRLYEEAKSGAEADVLDDGFSVEDIRDNIRMLNAYTDFDITRLSVDAFPSWLTRTSLPLRLLKSVSDIGSGIARRAEWLRLRMGRGDVDFDGQARELDELFEYVVSCNGSKQSSAAAGSVIRAAIEGERHQPRMDVLSMPYCATAARPTQPSLVPSWIADGGASIYSSSSMLTAALDSLGTGSPGASMVAIDANSLAVLPRSNVVEAVHLLSAMAIASADKAVASFRSRMASQLFFMLADDRFCDDRPSLETRLVALLECDGIPQCMLDDIVARASGQSGWLKERLLLAVPRVRAGVWVRQRLASRWLVREFVGLLELVGMDRPPAAGALLDKADKEALTVADLSEIVSVFSAAPPHPKYSFGNNSPFANFYFLFTFMLHAIPEPSEVKAAPAKDVEELRLHLKAGIHSNINEKNGLHIDRSRVKFVIERIEGLVVAAVQKEMSGYGQISLSNFFKNSNE